MSADIPNTGWNTTGTGTSGTGGGATTGGTGSTGGGMGGGGTDIGGTNTGGAFGASSGTDTGICPHCGQSMSGGGLEQFLGRLGISEDMINNLKTQWSNVDIDEYLTTARDYLKGAGDKATTYTKENPGKVAAGVAALALGAGLLYAATHRDK
jgi:hypothetical protein